MLTIKLFFCFAAAFLLFSGVESLYIPADGVKFTCEEICDGELPGKTYSCDMHSSQGMVTAIVRMIVAFNWRFYVIPKMEPQSLFCQRIAAADRYFVNGTSHCPSALRSAIDQISQKDSSKLQSNVRVEDMKRLLKDLNKEATKFLNDMETSSKGLRSITPTAAMSKQVEVKLELEKLVKQLEVASMLTSDVKYHQSSGSHSAMQFHQSSDFSGHSGQFGFSGSQGYYSSSAHSSYSDHSGSIGLSSNHALSSSLAHASLSDHSGSLAHTSHSDHSGSSAHTGHSDHSGSSGHTSHSDHPGSSVHTSHSDHPGSSAHTSHSDHSGHSGSSGQSGQVGSSGNNGHSGSILATPYSGHTSHSDHSGRYDNVGNNKEYEEMYNYNNGKGKFGSYNGKNDGYEHPNMYNAYDKTYGDMNCNCDKPKGEPYSNAMGLRAEGPGQFGEIKKLMYTLKNESFQLLDQLEYGPITDILPNRWKLFESLIDDLRNFMGVFDNPKQSKQSNKRKFSHDTSDEQGECVLCSVVLKDVCKDGRIVVCDDTHCCWMSFNQYHCMATLTDKSALTCYNSLFNILLSGKM